MVATSSRCPNPECRTPDNFEIVRCGSSRALPDGQALVLLAIQCASCGTVISFLPREDIPQYVIGIADKLGVR
jgi:hypothetical protein